MNYDDSVNDITPEILESLRLPGTFDEASHQTALDIDVYLKEDTRSFDELDARVAAHRDATLSHLWTLRPKTIFDLNIDWFRWPPSLYIPKDAKASHYWIGPAPDDHRYGLAWTAPASATANKASYLDGTLFSFSQLDPARARDAQSSESGLGIFYQPTMTLGVIDLQPQVDCKGTLRTFLEFFPKEAAGFVEVKAELLLAAWQQIPGGFDLLGFKQFDVATSGRRDQTFGPELHDFQRSFDETTLSAPFLVQRGRTYLLGVVSRISITSTLTDNQGRPLPPISNTEFRVWGSMNSIVPQISVVTKQVHIP